jgi:hypothetical protein
MGLDIRTPIGMMFLAKGILMAIYGMMTGGDTAMYQRSLGLNINLIWGAVMIVFGIIMLVMGRMGSSPAASLADPEPISAPGVE